MDKSEEKPIKLPVQFIVTKEGQELCIDCATEKGIEGVYISMPESWKGDNLFTCKICGKSC